ncbi:hypothetical protein TNCV_4999051 [Trichonephila clavipes]|nr:hypothetical protein TNCV_4999051 [Trichonephila clavipes]
MALLAWNGWRGGVATRWRDQWRVGAHRRQWRNDPIGLRAQDFGNLVDIAFKREGTKARGRFCRKSNACADCIQGACASGHNYAVVSDFACVARIHVRRYKLDATGSLLRTKEESL